MEPNVLFLTIQPDERIGAALSRQIPLFVKPALSCSHGFQLQGGLQDAAAPTLRKTYLDVMKGDLTLFVREDTIEQMWSVVDPINARWESKSPSRFPNYAAGSWGPAEAEQLLAREGRTWFTS